MDRIIDRPDMTLAVDRGRKASTQTNRKQYFKEQGLTLVSSADGAKCLDISSQLGHCLIHLDPVSLKP